MGITRKMPRWQASRSTTPRRGSARRKSVRTPWRSGCRLRSRFRGLRSGGGLRALATGTRPDPDLQNHRTPGRARLRRRRAPLPAFAWVSALASPEVRMAALATCRALPGLPNHKRLPRGFTRRVPRPRTGTIDIRSMLDCLSGNISLNHGHFWPRGQYMRRLGQDVSSADEIGIARVIAGDTSKHLSCAVAPIVLTTSGTCSGDASRIDSNGPNTVFPCRRFDPLSYPPIRPRGGGYAEVLASAFGFASFQSVQVLFPDRTEVGTLQGYGSVSGEPAKRAESEPP